jgi:hypothetical protein
MSTLFQRALILLGEQNFVSRTEEAQKTFHEVLKDTDIEKLDKMSRKQKFIAYARKKIRVINVCKKYSLITTRRKI